MSAKMPAKKKPNHKPLLILGLVVVLFVLTLLALANSDSKLRASAVQDDVDGDDLLLSCYVSCHDFYDQCTGHGNLPHSPVPENECELYYYLCQDRCEDFYGGPTDEDLEDLLSSSPTPSP